jgi:hypothetical protein
VSPWSNLGEGYPNAVFRKDQQGRVYLQGVAHKGPGAPAVGDVIAVLPVGYRPSGTRVFSPTTAGTNPGDPHSRLHVLATGELQWIGGATGDANFTSLDEVSFWTD